MQARPSGVELVLTGRYASEEVMAAADLVTEMREVKHYFASGTPARRGIEF
ncbi:MAG: cob(I)yrinic acid a,c-diamide adenosyltransferase [Gordonibacter sp.]